jgi:type VI protein secretion system component VasF
LPCACVSLESDLRVSRSLTIKQMTAVFAVAMVFIFIFCVILLFHFVQQNRYNTATQLESIIFP